MVGPFIRSGLKKLHVIASSESSLSFVEFKGPLPCSQGPAASPFLLSLVNLFYTLLPYCFKIRLMLSRAVPLIRRMYGSLSLRSGFSLMEVHAVFVVDKVTIGNVFLRLLRVSPIFITPQKLDCHSFIYYLFHLILAVDSSIRYHF
jgi:hypothetical protein